MDVPQARTLFSLLEASGVATICADKAYIETRLKRMALAGLPPNEVNRLKDACKVQAPQRRGVQLLFLASSVLLTGRGWRRPPAIRALPAPLMSWHVTCLKHRAVTAGGAQ